MHRNLFLLLFVPAVLVSALIAQSAPRYDEALNNYRAGKYEDALAVIRSVFDSNRNSTELRTLAGASYLAQGQTDPALAHARYCINANPQSISCRILKVRVLRRSDPVEAAHSAEGAIRETGENAALRLEAAAAYFVAGRLDLARRHLEKVIAANQKNFAALYLDGLIFLKQMRYEEAEFRLRNALNAAPPTRADAVRTLVNLGAAVENQAMALRSAAKSAEAAGRFREAGDLYRRALELNEQHAAARAGLERVRQAQ
ncbi:MAG: tetratricopeptide repeat protein [Leptospirales bacterium]|nr:tetratricopeptide repeat protein [Leptospirales bacterium]